MVISVVIAAPWWKALEANLPFGNLGAARITGWVILNGTVLIVMCALLSGMVRSSIAGTVLCMVVGFPVIGWVTVVAVWQFRLWPVLPYAGVLLPVTLCAYTLWLRTKERSRVRMAGVISATVLLAMILAITPLIVKWGIEIVFLEPEDYDTENLYRHITLCPSPTGNAAVMFCEEAKWGLNSRAAIFDTETGHATWVNRLRSLSDLAFHSEYIFGQHG